jgi:hypothetical protein
MAMGFISRAADQGRFDFEGQVQGMEDLDGLGNDFCADAVAWQDCDFHDGADAVEVGKSRMARPSSLPDRGSDGCKSTDRLLTGPESPIKCS